MSCFVKLEYFIYFPKKKVNTIRFHTLKPQVLQNNVKGKVLPKIHSNKRKYRQLSFFPVSEIIYYKS